MDDCTSEEQLDQTSGTEGMWRVQTTRADVVDHTTSEIALEALTHLAEATDTDADTVDTLSYETATPDPTPESVCSFLHRIPDLLSWVQRDGREFPWRPTDDPWRVYGIEILLQRTRAEAVAEIYEEFFEEFPTPEALLESDHDTIVETVSGLGFGKRRTQTLIAAARFVVEEHDGSVPKDSAELRTPKGIGPYTARATSVFGHGTPHGLVDTNTARVFGRVFGTPIPRKADEDDPAHVLADALTPAIPAVARAFNLALLDLGAMVCTPSDPDCDTCPLESACAYAQTGSEDPNESGTASCTPSSEGEQ